MSSRGIRTALTGLLGLALLAPLSATPAVGELPLGTGSAAAVATARVTLPGGGREVFGHRRFLAAYYGTAGTGVLGVLGETGPDAAYKRIGKAGKPFQRPGEQVLPVFELIVTVADGVPGPDSDYSHDIAHSLVQPYIDAAHRHGALLVLDIQPGRSDFLTVAKRWQWALEDPYVGLALDPEWRMGPQQIPGQTRGSVRAREVNRVSAWLARLVRAEKLPEKAFMLHQFHTSMLPDIGKVKRRDGLAMVQHVDGFGSPAQKLATYSAVARPRQFSMGFKLFYDEDAPRMKAAAVRRIRPAVRFVSFQ